MGMASSDNDAQIFRDHARKEHMKTIPQRPGSWDHPPTNREMSHYRASLEQWAAGLPAEPNPYENERR